MKAATNAHYAERYWSMVVLLTNAPKDASPQQIIATMQAEAEVAHQELDAETAQRIRVPQLVEAKPDPQVAERVRDHGTEQTNLRTGRGNRADQAAI
jgi:hypothetical protein